MPNLRFSFLATAGTVTFNAPDLTTNQENLFVGWLWAHYAPVDAQGVTLTRNAANEAQAYRNYAKALWLGTRANVISWKHELDKAAVTPPTVPES